MSRRIVFIILLFALTFTVADPRPAAAPAYADAAASPIPRLGTILYGASYYWEYMPYERLEQDVRLMEKLGITFVRLGESTWGVMEPRDGEFDFAWLARVLDRLHQAGIKVILGTPTYSIPAWLYKKHPEIQVKQINQDRYAYGLRQMTDLTHPTYRRYAERIIRKLVGRFKDHPAVIGYQLDNETHASGTADAAVQRRFREEIRAKFKTPEALNKAWGLNYWGQNISSFDELPPRDGILNPGYKLEWERFQRRIIADFLAWQAGIVNGLKRPDQFVSNDFAGVQTDLDPFEVARSLDVAVHQHLSRPAGPVHRQGDRLHGRLCALSRSGAATWSPRPTPRRRAGAPRDSSRPMTDSCAWPRSPTSGAGRTSSDTGTGTRSIMARKHTGRAFWPTTSNPIG